MQSLLGVSKFDGYLDIYYKVEQYSCHVYHITLSMDLESNFLSKSTPRFKKHH